MIFDIGEAAANIATGGATNIIGEGLGMALQPLKNRQQLNQQKRLQKLQIKGQKELSDYQQQQQLEMWKATNYKPQIEEMKKAGLNPGLIYGMKGGGGVTTGAGMPSAPTGGNAQIAQGMGINPMIASQMNLMRAQADNLDADTKKKGGIDTEAVTANIENMKQQTNNLKAQQLLTEAQTYAQEFTNLLNDESRTMTLEQIKQNLQLITTNVDKAAQEEKILRKSANYQIEIYKQQALEAGLKTILTNEQIGKTKQETANLRKTFSNMIQENMREWNKLGNQEQEIAIKKILAEVEQQKLNINPKDIIQLIHIIGNIQ